MSQHKTKEYFDGLGNLIIKPYRIKDLAAIFDVNQQTLKRWMSKHPRQLGNRDGRYYSVHQVNYMIEVFGLPHKIPVESIIQTNKAA
jgi:hypothetical protein